MLGGTGLLGEPIARAFLERGARVTVVSRGASSAPPGATVLVADRRDDAALERALRGRRFDLTIDLLAYDADDVARLVRVPQLALGRVVTISTGQVYLVSDEARPPFREEDAELPARPEPASGTREHANWVYGVGKRRMEAALRALPGSPLALRIPVVIGAGDRTGRLWAYVLRLLDGGPLLVPGALDQPLRFVWAQDVARVLVAITERDANLGPALNWAQPDVLTFEGFVRTLAGALGVAVPPLVRCTAEELATVGLDDEVSPFVSRWCSVPDPARAIAALSLSATPFAEALPHVLAGLRAASPPPDDAYARRPAELALAARLRAPE